MGVVSSTAGPIQSSEDFVTLDGLRFFRLTVAPSARPWARLFLLHGYCDHVGRYRHFFQWMAERGVACSGFDMRGHGRSEGRRVYVARWEQYLKDATRVMEMWAGAGGAVAPSFILGQSHGGLVAAMGVIREKWAADGLILCSPYLRNGVPVPWWREALARAVGVVAPWARFASNLPEDWLTSDGAMLEESRRDPLLQHEATPRWFVQTLRMQREAMRRAREVTLPLLCITGDADRVALPSAVEEFYGAAGSAEKALSVYPGMKHETLRERGRVEVFERILAWMRARDVGRGA